MALREVQVQARTAPALSFEDMQLPADELHDAPSSDYKICLVLQGEARLSYRVDDRWHSQWLRPGMFAPITPPHSAATLRLSQAQRHLMISVDERVFAQVAADAGCPNAQLGALLESAFNDAFLGQLCRRAWAESSEGDALGQSFAGFAATALVCGLLRGAVGQRARARTVTHQHLSPAALSRIRERCLSSLPQHLSVAELAEDEGIEARLFSRAFKGSTGQTPQQYLISLRVQRARELLLDSQQPIADIALACGFYDQSHLTTAFTRFVGVSPSRYRRRSSS
jgi:AraC-like DNA-binding protein